MSASLVGSEMCIRDRRSSPWLGIGERRSPRTSAPGARICINTPVPRAETDRDIPNLCAGSEAWTWTVRPGGPAGAE
eukprot:13489485-Alexandrium_andersonii.AAC.1